MVIDFKFKPLDKVKIVAYDSNILGRVQRCYIDSSHRAKYDVEYFDNASFNQRYFHEDELELME